MKLLRIRRNQIRHKRAWRWILNTSYDSSLPMWWCRCDNKFSVISQCKWNKIELQGQKVICNSPEYRTYRCVRMPVSKQICRGRTHFTFFRILTTPKISAKAAAQFLKSRKNFKLNTDAENGGGKVRNGQYISSQLICDTHSSQPNSTTYKYKVIPADSKSNGW